MTPRFHTLRIAEVRRETAEAVSLEFEVPPALAPEYAFVQGQHITLRTRVDGAEIRRSYSICAGIDDGRLRVAIKRVAGGKFSTWANSELRPGISLDVLTPDGRFHTRLDPAHCKRYAAFAAGAGITPVLSLIKTTLAREPRSRFTLLYGNRRLSSVLFHEELEDLKDRYLSRFTLYNLFSREPQEIDLFNGRLDGAKVQAFADTLLPADSIDEAFVCGPGEMIDEVETALQACGLPLTHIHSERFGVPNIVAEHRAEPDDAPQSIVTLISDGVQRELDFHRTDPSILDAALQAGFDLPFACKSGVCCTCRAKLLSGKVRMDKNYGLDSRDLAAGYVLTCQAHPLTDRVVVSYDDR
jgi:ring-1,2-phenylacetyl-CoA epoxidase subunit PaaE